MQPSYAKAAGTLLFIGAIQFILALIISEALYTGYSTSANYISDLGVGPSAIIFNTSVFLLGTLIIASAYLILQAFDNKVLTTLLVLTGIGAMGVGVFTEDAGMIHAIVSLIVFLFGTLSAIASYKASKPPFSYLSIVLGLTGLVALILFATRNNLGLGVGGMERMIAYPVLLWAVGFGGHLINQPESTAPKTAQ